MVNYQEGKIYTLRSHQTELVYVGSTCTPLPKRFYKHKQDYNGWMKEYRPYISSYEVLQFEDCYIELHEACPCQNKAELERREGEIVREIDCVNKRIPGRKQPEYYEANKEHILEQKKTYRLANPEKFVAKDKKYYEENKVACAARKKKYRERKKQEKEESLNVVQDGGSSTS